MKLNFFWDYTSGAFSPGCTSSVLNHDGVSPLACLLTDDGGQVYSDTLPWLEEGVRLITSVKESESGFADWSRDAWGAELTKEQVKVYSLHDEDYFEMITAESFESVLLAWIGFIKSIPAIGSTRSVEL